MATKVAANSEKTKNNSQKRGPGKPFAKGVSGNPTGRPKKTEEQKKADADAENALMMLKDGLPKAVEIVKGLLEEPTTPPNVKVKILELMLDRTYGKAFQSVQVDSTEGNTAGIVIMPAREVLKGGD